jgi:hypothetical protein
MDSRVINPSTSAGDSSIAPNARKILLVAMLRRMVRNFFSEPHDKTLYG